MISFNAVPWVPIDLNRTSIEADTVFDITYEDHQMSFSSFPIQVGYGEHVVFNAIVVTGCDHDDVRAAEIGEQS